MSWIIATFLIYASMDPDVILANCCRYKFPEEFYFSLATSAFQIEGAWKADGKGESIWDNYTHTYPYRVNGTIKDADISDNSYYLYREDIQLMKNMGFSVHRFSISWPRILPNGDLSYINPAGIRHYHDFIDYLLANGIEPMVTMYHWDLPQKLQDKGGWLNDTIIDYFQAYANLLFQEYGPKVKWWCTINEPIPIIQGYVATNGAPSLNSSTPDDYIVGHHLLLAHAAAYRLYDQEYRSCQNGKVTIVLSSGYYMPANYSSKEDREAAERALQFTLGWFAHPIYSKEGDYPPLIRKLVDENSLAEGRTSSRLPYFTQEEIKRLKGSADFFALNHYTTYLCRPGILPTYGASYVNIDENVIAYSIPNLPGSDVDPTLKIYPQGFRKLVVWVKQQYNSPTIFITENGFGDSGTLNDTLRIFYYKQYLKALLTAMRRDKCHVIGYTGWSLLDNFEWTSGYTNHFGIVSVDFQRSDRRRTKKKSAYFWTEFLKSRCLD